MASDAHKQPPWNPPKARPDAQLPRLKIYNSLTRSKDDFVPLDPTGKMVTWYACGPTVYEDAHLGHAKDYVSTDIIRRIMKDHFGFRVKFVMNMTDIDDKIILRGRQQYLLARFKQEHATRLGERFGFCRDQIRIPALHWQASSISALGYEPRDFFRGSRCGI